MTVRVALDVRRATWAPQLGISRYARNLGRSIDDLGDTEVELTRLDLRSPSTLSPTRSIVVGRGHHFVRRFFQDQFAIPWATRQSDLVHLPWYEGPFHSSCPVIVNVHDLDTLVNAKSYSLRFRAYYNSLLRAYLRTARRIIVPSHATADALEAWWPRRPYAVIPYGVDPIFFARREVPELGLPAGGDGYVLYTGGFSARKGIDDLLTAFESVASAVRDVRLVITGPAPTDFATMISGTRSRDRIVLTGYVDDERLAQLYRRATVVAYPSTLEGFGFPVVEGFAAGTAVVATRGGSIPEIAGDAAVLVEPRNAQKLAEALLSVIREPAFAASLVAAGRKRADLYRWSETARRTVALYVEAVG